MIGFHFFDERATALFGYLIFLVGSWLRIFYLGMNDFVYKVFGIHGGFSNELEQISNFVRLIQDFPVSSGGCKIHPKSTPINNPLQESVSMVERCGNQS